MEGKWGPRRPRHWARDPFVAEPDAPKGYWERDTGGNYWGDWLEREPGIEMQALSKAEAPFGANMSRVLRVSKKFAPKVTAKLEQMGETAVKRMGWVSEVLEDGTEAFLGGLTRDWRHDRPGHADDRGGARGLAPPP